MQEPAPNPEVPLVQRVALPAPRKPRPGFWGAVLWCLLFIAVQLGCAIGTITIILVVHMLRSDNPSQFINEQLSQFAKAAAPTKPDEPPRPPVPTELGQAIAYGMLAAQVGSLGLILLVVPRAVGPGWKRQLGVRVPAGLHVFLVILVLPAFMILADGIQELFLRLTGITRPAANEALNGTFGTVPGLVTFLAVAFGPGLVEEFWCRGFLGRGLCARYGMLLGVVSTSFLFGMLHIDPSHVMIAALMGAYLHFVYLATRSIWVPVLLHLMNNGLAVFLALAPALQDAAKSFQEDKHGLRAVMDLASLGLVVFASVALWTSRAEVIRVPAKDGLPDANEWKQEYPGISLPPAGAPEKLSYGTLSPAAMFLAMGSFGILAYLLSQLGK
ncbi:MAG: hypothetical protein C0467_03640 [Planctomycetaceae bacterium]|nr:hypothetical protein [Planctomycetaceae bacterium]